MGLSPPRNRLIAIAIGLLLLFTPAILIILSFAVLSLTTEIVLDQITPLVFVELYLLDLLLFVAFGYGVYRVTIWVVTNRIPDSLDAIESDDADQDRRDADATKNQQ
ncbi:hypothetical protein [Halorubellus salinus]|uniref:hypothetical protein n=1 Tax=Halorubellus salinus TaxID=755309 RepID=UPI001D06030C|nr:hypothetical protein [Halorubellus salinus]